MNAFHAAAMAQTNGICAYCSATVDPATGIAATAGSHEGWQAFCSQDHYEQHRGQPLASVLLWRAPTTKGPDQ